MTIMKSCGAIVFTKERGQIKYLIELYEKQYYGFPKGHWSPDTSDEKCAITEIKKETGIDIDLVDGFVTYDSYPLIYKNLPNVTKNIVYFLAEFKDQIPKALDPEISEIYLMSYEDAMKILPFESSKRILTEAHTFLINK